MTWLCRLNFYLLQWTGFRLAKVTDELGTSLGWKLIRAKPMTGWKR